MVALAVQNKLVVRRKIVSVLAKLQIVMLGTWKKGKSNSTCGIATGTDDCCSGGVHDGNTDGVALLMMLLSVIIWRKACVS